MSYVFYHCKLRKFVNISTILQGPQPSAIGPVLAFVPPKCVWGRALPGPDEKAYTHSWILGRDGAKEDRGGKRWESGREGDI